MTLDTIEQLTRIIANVIAAICFLGLAILAARWINASHRILTRQRPTRTRNRDDIEQPQW